MKLMLGLTLTAALSAAAIAAERLWLVVWADHLAHLEKEHA